MSLVNLHDFLSLTIDNIHTNCMEIIQEFVWHLVVTKKPCFMVLSLCLIEQSTQTMTTVGYLHDNTQINVVFIELMN